MSLSLFAGNYGLLSFRCSRIMGSGQCRTRVGLAYFCIIWNYSFPWSDIICRFSTLGQLGKCMYIACEYCLFSKPHPGPCGQTKTRFIFSRDWYCVCVWSVFGHYSAPFTMFTITCSVYFQSSMSLRMRGQDLSIFLSIVWHPLTVWTEGRVPEMFCILAVVSGMSMFARSKYKGCLWLLVPSIKDVYDCSFQV